MRVTRLLSFILTMIVSVGAGAQTVIAVAERNDFAGHIRYKYGKYRTRIRPIFVKNDTGWAVIDKLPARLKMYALNGRRSINATRADSLGTVSSWDGELYRTTSRMRSWIPFPAMDSVFEHSDILKYQVLASSPGKVSRERLQVDSLTEPERKKIAVKIVDRARLLAIKEVGDTAGFEWSDRLFQPEADTFLLPVLKTFVLRDGSGVKLIFQTFPPSHPFVHSALSPNGFREDNGSVLRLFSIAYPGRELRVFYADMLLLEHADFDGDGEEEYLFFCSRFNHYGYMLMYDDFQRIAHYEWTYH